MRRCCAGRGGRPAPGAAGSPQPPPSCPCPLALGRLAPPPRGSRERFRGARAAARSARPSCATSGTGAVRGPPRGRAWRAPESPARGPGRARAAPRGRARGDGPEPPCGPWAAGTRVPAAPVRPAPSPITGAGPAGTLPRAVPARAGGSAPGSDTVPAAAAAGLRLSAESCARECRGGRGARGRARGCPGSGAVRGGGRGGQRVTAGRAGAGSGAGAGAGLTGPCPAGQWERRPRVRVGMGALLRVPFPVGRGGCPVGAAVPAVSPGREAPGPGGSLWTGRGAGPASPAGEEAELGLCSGVGVRPWARGSLGAREAEGVNSQHLC